MTSAEELKEHGNRAFAQKEFAKAAQIYRDAIQLDMYNPVLYSNRAQCFLNLRDYERAYQDAISGLNLGASHALQIKLTFRKAMALKELGRWDRARETFKDVLRIDPLNNAAKMELDLLPSTLNAASGAMDEEKPIVIEIVERLPEEFANLLKDNAKSDTLNSDANSNPNLDPDPQSSSAVDAEIENLFGKNSLKEETEIEPKKIQSDFASYTSSPLRFLSAMKNVPQAQKANAYNYVLNLDEGSYSELFSESGIDPDFLQFFLEAANYALENNPSQSLSLLILQRLRQFSSFKRSKLSSAPG
ncbi:uncharacterized protein LODBEIA_P05640 [Lodderomyces beijingensis]|uniref:RNA polymerase II-associated protein 3 n=1 Tax=Lodderomyces beijingensis TaxID=1775926 RepID=A0ABP0ZDT6_9ASCO